MSYEEIDRGDSPFPVKVPIRWTVHLFSVIPANDSKESMFGHQIFTRPEQGLSL